MPFVRKFKFFPFVYLYVSSKKTVRSSTSYPLRCHTRAGAKGEYGATMASSILRYKTLKMT
jgi:hypothetical protein